MNFIRKKPSAPLDDLTDLYNETANKTIYNLGLEQKNELKKAVQGWKALHTHVLFKLDLIDKAYSGSNYSADEIYLREGIEDLDRKGLRHLDRVNRAYDDLVNKYEMRQNLSKYPSNNSTYSVPTLRSHSPQQNQQQQQQPTQSSSRMLKTLRPERPHKFNSNHNYANKPSELSKIAATTMYYQPSKQNWSTSKSLNSSSTSAFNKSHNPDDIFDQSFEDVDFDLKTLKRNDAFSQLEATGTQSQLARSKPNDEVASQFEKLRIDSPSKRVTSGSSKPGFPSVVHSTPNLIDIDGKASPFNDPISDSTSTTTSSPTPPKPPPSRPPIPKTKPLPINRPKPSSVPTQKPTVPRQAVPKPQTTTRPTIRTPVTQPKKAVPLKKTIPTAKPTTATTRQPATKPTTTSTTPRRTIPTTTAKPAATTRTTRPGVKAATNPTTTQAAKRAVKPTSTSTTTRPAVRPTKLPTTKPQTTTSLTPRSRSQSPIRGETKDTETISSNEEDSDGFADESQLSEKEIREKMEEQIISEIRGIDHGAAKQIFNEIVVHGDEVHWDDIAGLETAKNSLKETVVYPFLRPDLFSGLREPARGMLLFGPPGTGKTMLARAVATESKSTFFSISASSLTSKFLGESEKLVRALFMLAKKLSPSIIFVDEIDSLLSSRNESGEHESSRRIKNEFLIQWSDLTHAAAGKDTGEDLQRVLVLAATNLPWAIDEAARRRFVRRQYIPLPEPETRQAQISKLLAHQKHTLDEKDQLKLIEMTDGFSGSDITALAKDAAMGPLRSLGDKLLSTARDEIRPINLSDFESSLKYIRPSVSKENLNEFEDWASKYGSSGV